MALPRSIMKKARENLRESTPVLPSTPEKEGRQVFHLDIVAIREKSRKGSPFLSVTATWGDRKYWFPAPLRSPLREKDHVEVIGQLDGTFGPEDAPFWKLKGYDGWIPIVRVMNSLFEKKEVCAESPQVCGPEADNLDNVINNLVQEHGIKNVFLALSKLL